MKYFQTLEYDALDRAVNVMINRICGDSPTCAAHILTALADLQEIENRRQVLRATIERLLPDCPISLDQSTLKLVEALRQYQVCRDAMETAAKLFVARINFRQTLDHIRRTHCN